MTTRLGYENPLVSTVDMVVPNDQGQSQQAYADQTASTLLLSGPNVLVFDEVTLPYYYSNLQDLSSLYSYLRDNLTQAQFSKLRPIYLSERQAQQLLIDYEINYGAEGIGGIDDLDMSVYDDNPIMIGIAVEDEDAITALGYQNLWPEYETTLVFSIYTQTMNYSDSELIIMELLSSVL